MKKTSKDSPVRKWKPLAAFAAVYILWGATYLAMRVAVQSIPPFLLAGTRFLTAGLILFAFARWRGARMPGREGWKHAFVIGTLMLLGGNGGVVWALQFIPSGIAALLIATVPLWTLILQFFSKHEKKPSTASVCGILLGFAGLGLLISPEAGRSGTPPGAAAAVMIGALAWAWGGLYSRRVTLSDSAPMAIAMSMITGGIMLHITAFLTGEHTRFNPGAVTPEALGALLFLIFLGGLVGFTAYLWLVKHTSPAQSSTYAYVNPVVAVFLGWWILGETLTPKILAGAAVIIAAVVMVTLSESGRITAIEEA